ncbi:antirestriction protein ArdA [Propionimicrobium sp. PCR01-08-3]|uniref:antirestriction protein ArdA n=1 Tax=Propionimicrobium sp. PCR01-08-3 TaxID=3052086 RepID=UPI00255C2DF6|nr:antirestriction protein ArdA [Propionimicrobium sp. PCR01-08-3]WIY83938.1 antirestriction protein ArdA [Propionimicrobium sp. PCR01-08-3]
MSAVATDCTPRVWVGCLHCYNSGRLVGEWFDAAGAGDVDLAAVHEGSGSLSAACEELWCLDHENIPQSGEMGLLEAAEWDRVHEEVGPDQWPALCAWVSSGMHVVEGTGDIPSVSDFEERFAGHWDSFREYAEDLAESTGLQQGWPEEAVRYFNWDSWTSDLAYDYTVVDAPADQGYGVFIFRNL